MSGTFTSLACAMVSLVSAASIAACNANDEDSATTWPGAIARREFDGGAHHGVCVVGPDDASIPRRCVCDPHRRACGAAQGQYRVCFSARSQVRIKFG